MKYFTIMALIAVVSAKPIQKGRFDISGFQTQDEIEAHQREIQMANIEAHRNERIRQKMARLQAQKLANKGKPMANAREINPFGGLIHEANGVRRFPDGTIVDGSNDGVGYIGLHDDDIRF